MAGIKDCTELDVWKLCDELRKRMRPIVKRPPFAEYPRLRDQLDEAVERTCPNIAEGFARFTPRDNARFARIATGSLAEVIEHLNRARARQLITVEEADDLESLTRRAKKAASGYIAYLDSAKEPKIRRRRRGTKPPTPTGGEEP